MADEKYDDSYVRCERDIMAWLTTQVPVPVCQSLIFRIKDGDHRGCGPGLDREWEIPITIKVEDPIQMKYLHTLIRFDGGELSVSDNGKFVVVPMFSPVDRVQHALCELYRIGVASVGVPVRFRENQRVSPPERLVHILLHGRTLCGYPTGFPSDWPEGVYCSIHEAPKQATCQDCLDHYPDVMKDLAISEEARG